MKRSHVVTAVLLLAVAALGAANAVSRADFDALSARLKKAERSLAIANRRALAALRAVRGGEVKVSKLELMDGKKVRANLYVDDNGTTFAMRNARGLPVLMLSTAPAGDPVVTLTGPRGGNLVTISASEKSGLMALASKTGTMSIINHRNSVGINIFSPKRSTPSTWLVLADGRAVRR